jgi:hypothetical protein
MNWQIVPQETKDGGEVCIKAVRFYPVKNKRGEVITFGRMSDDCIRLFFAHDGAPDWEKWMVTRTKHGYNVTCPRRRILVSKPWETPEYKIVPGVAFGGREKSGSMSERGLREFLTQQCGKEFSDEILGWFDYAELAA